MMISSAELPSGDALDPDSPPPEGELRELKSPDQWPAEGSSAECAVCGSKGFLFWLCKRPQTCKFCGRKICSSCGERVWGKMSGEKVSGQLQCANCRDAPRDDDGPADALSQGGGGGAVVESSPVDTPLEFELFPSVGRTDIRVKRFTFDELQAVQGNRWRAYVPPPALNGDISVLLGRINEDPLVRQVTINLPVISDNLYIAFTQPFGRPLESISRSGRHLEGDPCISEFLTNDALFALGDKCCRLTTLDLCGCPHISDEGVICLARGCKTLVRLDISYSKIKYALSELATECHDLKELKLKSCRQLAGAGESNAEGVAALARCQALEVLDLENAEAVTDYGISALAKCASLTTLNIEGCANVTHQGLSALAECSRLTALSWRGINSGCTTDEVVFELSKCKKLAKLIVNCCRVTECGLSELTKCARLTHLELLSCDNLTGKGMSALDSVLANCTQLTFLSLRGCQSSLDKCLLTVAAACTALQTLVLDDPGETVTDQGLSALAKCNRLSRLEVPGCAKVTCAGVQKLVSGCTQLEWITLSDCVEVAVEGISALKVCKKLTKLNIANCSKLTDAALCALAKSSTELRHLNVSGCFELTDKGIYELVAACTKLEYLDLSGLPEVTRLPIQFADLHNLKHLTLPTEQPFPSRNYAGTAYASTRQPLPRALAFPVPEVCKKDNAKSTARRIVEHMQALKYGSEPAGLKCIKMMVVGDEMVGKTTFIKALRRYSGVDGFPWSGTAEADRTEGVDVTSWWPTAECALAGCSEQGVNFKRCKRCRAVRYCSIECQQMDWKTHKAKCIETKGSPSAPPGQAVPCKQDGIEYIIFDFAGQESYYASHALYMTERSIYVLVVDLADEDWSKSNPGQTNAAERACLWLDSIQARAPGAAVMLVGTKADKAPTLAEQRMQIMKKVAKNWRIKHQEQQDRGSITQVLSIQECSIVSGKNSRGLEDFRTNLTRLCGSDGERQRRLFPGLASDVPKLWAVLKRAVQRSGFGVTGATEDEAAAADLIDHVFPRDGRLTSCSLSRVYQHASVRGIELNKTEKFNQKQQIEKMQAAEHWETSKAISERNGDLPDDVFSNDDYLKWAEYKRCAEKLGFVGERQRLLVEATIVLQDLGLVSVLRSGGDEGPQNIGVFLRTKVLNFAIRRLVCQQSFEQLALSEGWYKPEFSEADTKSLEREVKMADDQAIFSLRLLQGYLWGTESGLPTTTLPPDVLMQALVQHRLLLKLDSIGPGGGYFCPAALHARPKASAQGLQPDRVIDPDRVIELSRSRVARVWYRFEFMPPGFFESLQGAAFTRNRVNPSIEARRYHVCYDSGSGWVAMTWHPDAAAHSMSSTAGWLEFTEVDDSCNAAGSPLKLKWAGLQALLVTFLDELQSQLPGLPYPKQYLGVPGPEQGMLPSEWDAWQRSSQLPIGKDMPHVKLQDHAPAFLFAVATAKSADPDPSVIPVPKYLEASIVDDAVKLSWKGPAEPSIRSLDVVVRWRLDGSDTGFQEVRGEKLCSSNTSAEITGLPDGKLEITVSYFDETLGCEGSSSLLVRVSVEAGSGSPAPRGSDSLAPPLSPPVPERAGSGRRQFRLLCVQSASNPGSEGIARSMLEEQHKNGAVIAGIRNDLIAPAYNGASLFQTCLTYDDLIKTLQNVARCHGASATPLVLHFCGHGEVCGLVFEGSPLGPDDLAALVAKCGPACVLLNACNTDSTGRAIVAAELQPEQQSIPPTVICWRGPVRSTLCVALSTTFYGRLSETLTLPSATQTGRADLFRSAVEEACVYDEIKRELGHDHNCLKVFPETDSSNRAASPHNDTHGREDAVWSVVGQESSSDTICWYVDESDTEATIYDVGPDLEGTRGGGRPIMNSCQVPREPAAVTQDCNFSTSHFEYFCELLRKDKAKILLSKFFPSGKRTVNGEEDITVGVGPSQEIWFQLDGRECSIERSQGYVASDNLIKTTTTGAGSGLKVVIKEVNATGAISSFRVHDHGIGYSWGDKVYIHHGQNPQANHASFRITWHMLQHTDPQGRGSKPSFGRDSSDPLAVVHIHFAGTDTEPKYNRATSMNIRWSLGYNPREDGMVYGKWSPYIGRASGRVKGVGKRGLNVTGKDYRMPGERLKSCLCMNWRTVIEVRMWNPPHSWSERGEISEDERIKLCGTFRRLHPVTQTLQFEFFPFTESPAGSGPTVAGEKGYLVKFVTEEHKYGTLVAAGLVGAKFNGMECTKITFEPKDWKTDLGWDFRSERMQMPPYPSPPDTDQRAVRQVPRGQHQYVSRVMQDSFNLRQKARAKQKSWKLKTTWKLAEERRDLYLQLKALAARLFKIQRPWSKIHSDQLEDLLKECEEAEENAKDRGDHTCAFDAGEQLNHLLSRMEVTLE